MNDIILIVLSLIGAYGIGRFIRYQRWSPEPKPGWVMTYERKAVYWDYYAKRSDPYESELGSALTYRAAVRRSRRAAFNTDRRITITYAEGK